MTTAAHPSFLSAPREKRWIGNSWPLYDQLLIEAYRSPTSEAELALDSGWAWRILEDGVVVGLRTVGKSVHGLYRLELRLAVAADGLSTGEWESRVGELLRAFMIRLAAGEKPCPYAGALWAAVPLQGRDEGKHAARYVTLLMGEIAPPERRER